jgi:hypothetical protein
MIEFFLTTLRLVRGMASAWRRDPQFRSLVFLVELRRSTLLRPSIPALNLKRSLNQRCFS